MKKFDINKALKLFAEYSVMLEEMTKTQKIIDGSYDKKKNKAIYSKLNKLVWQIVELDLEAFITLLDDANIVVAEMAAEYLFPFFPRKCLVIMNNYLKTLNNELDIHKMELKIKGLREKQPFFMERYFKMFKCDDLSKLNREK